MIDQVSLSSDDNIQASFICHSYTPINTPINNVTEESKIDKAVIICCARVTVVCHSISTYQNVFIMLQAYN